MRCQAQGLPSLSTTHFLLLLLLLLLLPQHAAPQISTISTYIGGAPDTGVSALTPTIRYATAVARNAAGSGWLLATNDCVREILANGSASLIAGVCYAGTSSTTPPGDGAVALNNPAGAARLFSPSAMAARLPVLSSS